MSRDRRRPAGPAGRCASPCAVVALLVVVGVGYFAVSLYQVWSTGRTDQARPVDAIVVMGAAQYDGRPSPQLAARLDHVVELWPQGLAPLVVVTGGNRPGDRFTEAQASAAYLTDRGVPADAILLEDQGTNSYESLRGVAELLRPAWPRRRADRHRSVPRAAQPADRRAGRADGPRVADADQRRHRAASSPGASCRRPPASPLGRLIGFQHI